MHLFPQVRLAGLFLLAALLAFAINLNSYFLSDDFVQIGKVLHGDFSVAWGQSHGGFFRPLFILSYVIESRIWRAHPLGYHFTNVAIHAFNSFLVFNLGLRFLERLRLPAPHIMAAAGTAAAFFLLHPSHTEAVIWISGRADLMATFFCLASLWWYCRFAHDQKWTNLATALVMGGAALLAKESAICLPFLVLVVGLYFARGRRVLIETGLFGLVLAVFVALRAWYLGTLIGGYGVGQHLNFAGGWIRDRLLEATVRSVLPALPASWSFFLFKPLQSPLFYFITLLTFGFVALVIVIRRRRYTSSERKSQNRFLLFMAGLFLISLLPAINLRLSLYESLGERFLYLPTVWSCLLLSYLLIIIARNQQVWLLLLFCVLGFYSWRLYAGNQLWREAAQLTRSIRNDLSSSMSPPQLTILNAPDNLRGVPVFHNGLPEALQFFPGPTQFDRVEITSFQTLQSSSDTNGFQPSTESFKLLPANRLDAFDRPASASCLEVISRDVAALEFKPQACLNKSAVYYFSQGRMQPALP